MPATSFKALNGRKNKPTSLIAIIFTYSLYRQALLLEKAIVTYSIITIFRNKENNRISKNIMPHVILKLIILFLTINFLLKV